MNFEPKIAKYLKDDKKPENVGRKDDNGYTIWGSIEAHYKVNKNLKACAGCDFFRPSEIRQGHFRYFCDNEDKLTRQQDNTPFVQWNGICDLYKEK